MAEWNGAKNLLQVTQLLPITESQPIGPRSNAIALNVRFGSKADICSAKRHVRFTPNRWGNRPALLWIAEDFGCCASG